MASGFSMIFIEFKRQELDVFLQFFKLYLQELSVFIEFLNNWKFTCEETHENIASC